MRLPYDVELEELRSESEVVLAAVSDGTGMFAALAPVDGSSEVTVEGLPFLAALDPVDSSTVVSWTYQLDAQVALDPVDSTTQVLLIGVGGGETGGGPTGPLTGLSDVTVSDNPPITLALVLQATLQAVPGGYALDPEWPAELPDLTYDDTDAVPAVNVTTIPAPSDSGGTGADTSPPTTPPEGPPTMGGTVVTGPYNYLTYGSGHYGDYEPVHAKVGLPGVAYADLTDNTGSTWQMTAGGFYDMQRVRRRIDVDTEEEIIFTRSLFEGDAFLSSSAGLVTALRNKKVKIKLFDCELRPATPSMWWAGLYGHGIEAHRCWIRDVVDGVDVLNPYGPAVDVALYGNLIEDLSLFSDSPTHSDHISHNDTIQWFGGQNLTVVGNALRAVLNPAIGAASLDAAHRDPVAGGGPNNPLAVSGNAYGYNPNYPHLQANSCLQANAGLAALGQLLWQKNWHYGGGFQINVGGDHGSQALGSFLDNIHDPSWRFGAYAIPSPTPNRGLTFTAPLVNNRRKDNGALAPVYVAAGNTLTPAPR